MQVDHSSNLGLRKFLTVVSKNGFMKCTNKHSPLEKALPIYTLFNYHHVIRFSRAFRLFLLSTTKHRLSFSRVAIVSNNLTLLV